MNRIGMGLVGPGFIAAHHINAVRRLGGVDIVGIAGSTQEFAVRKGTQLGVGRAYGDYRDLIADPDIDLVHNTTPNYLHFPVATAALQAGKHVISDKPSAMTAEEGRKLRNAALDAKVAHVVTLNYRGNPSIQQARCMVAEGELGELRFAHGVYVQDWMTDPHVYSWRSDPLTGGISSALGDIGFHWCDPVEHISGPKIETVISDLSTTIPVRYTTGISADAFSIDNTEKDYRVRVDGEDLASVLLRFENGAKGSLSVGQALRGHKNDLQVEVCGAAMSLKWKQEQQNELRIGYQVHAVHLKNEEIHLLAQSGAVLCSCPTTERNLGDGIFAADRVMNAGIRVARGSDSQAQIDPLEDARQLEYHLRLQHQKRAILDEIHSQAIAPRRFECATMHGARSLAVPAGDLMPGSFADFFTVDLSDVSIAGQSSENLLPILVFALNRSAIRDVVVNGTFIIRDGKHSLQDEIISRYTEVYEKVWRSSKAERLDS